MTELKDFQEFQKRGSSITIPVPEGKAGRMVKPHGKDEVVRAIIQAAIPLIAERGVKAVTFRDVAQAANVNHALIARHFGTKNGLVGQISEHLVHLFFDAAKQSRPGFMGPLWQTIAENRVEVGAFARIIQETLPDPNRQPDNRQILGEVLEWLRATVGLDTGAHSSMANLAIYMLAVLFLGGETFGRHLQVALGLSDTEFASLRESAFEQVLERLHPPPRPDS